LHWVQLSRAPPEASMCRGKHSVAADEVWEEEQNSSSDESEIDSEPEHENNKTTLQSRIPPVQQPVFAKSMDMQPAMLGVCIPPKSQAPVAPAAPRDTQGELVKLVNHLRNDNARLHDALNQAQRSLEIVAENQAAREAAPNIDFAHLLALVRDFGDYTDGLEGFEQTQLNQEEDFQAFVISSPRASQHHGNLAEPGDDEASTLKMELQNMRLEVSQLRAELSSKDAELRILRSTSSAFQSDVLL